MSLLQFEDGLALPWKLLQSSNVSNSNSSLGDENANGRSFNSYESSGNHAYRNSKYNPHYPSSPPLPCQNHNYENSMYHASHPREPRLPCRNRQYMNTQH